MIRWDGLPRDIQFCTVVSLSADLESLASICKEYAIEEVVLGYPLNMNGTVGSKAEEIKEFGSILGDYLQLPISYWDERLTTVSAERMLNRCRCFTQETQRGY